MSTTSILTISLIFFATSISFSQESDHIELEINNLVSPYVNTNNFSGAILVSKNGKIIFEESYGQKSREYNLEHSIDSKFFLASVSMIFTSAAIMKLSEEGKISLEDPLSKFYPEYKHGQIITIHDMLAQRSGIPAIGYDEKVDYDEITKFTQDPNSLFEYFKEYDLLFSPGSKYNHGRSDYILLAGIIERLSGKSFGQYLKEEIFEPLGMNESGHYNSESEIITNLAKGYSPNGLYDVESAYNIDWSSKTGHASIYSTVTDLQKFANTILNGELLSQLSWEKIFTDYGNNVGYGWFIRDHLNRERYQMNGRSPGFSSYFAIYPGEELIISVLSNNYISLPPDIGLAIAAIVLVEPYEPLNLSKKQFEKSFAQKFTGTYKFGDNFYVPDHNLHVKFENGNLITDWGGLIPIDTGDATFNKYILRTYWSDVQFIENENGEVKQMEYDGFKGVKLE